jgi:hypothetical protein
MIKQAARLKGVKLPHFDLPEIEGCMRCSIRDKLRASLRSGHWPIGGSTGDDRAGQPSLLVWKKMVGKIDTIIMRRIEIFVTSILLTYRKENLESLIAMKLAVK